jgi:Ca-activated chloride channel homolog
VARDCAIGVLEALGPQDELGVVLWDGYDRWLFNLGPTGDKRAMRSAIAGMNQGDLPSFQNVMTMAHQGLQDSRASLKHIIVFSDGDPAAPSLDLMQSIVSDRITVSSVLIAGHAGPEIMIAIAEQGRGNFYNVSSPDQLPQIFIKEAALILKSAISEEPFLPQWVSSSELIRGIHPSDYPPLRGYVATSAKARAETPLFTDKGDPLLAHWQYGLGRAVAFTSDARAKWAQDWLGWPQYRQFWAQVVQWSLRRLDTADLIADVNVDRGEGLISIDALDAEGNYRNFLQLEAVVVSPRGDRQTLRLEQSGPGHYQARFPTREIGAYLVNILEREGDRLVGARALGASVNYSPEFEATEPNLHFLHRLAEAGGGRMLDPGQADDNPFLHNRVKTHQPRDLWIWLVQLAILLFPVDVGVRRIYLDRAEWSKALRVARRYLLFWQPPSRPVESDVSLAALLVRRDQVRTRRATESARTGPESIAPRGPAVKAPVVAPPIPTVAPPGKQPASGAGTEELSTASRLLEAKRRAQKRKP